MAISKKIIVNCPICGAERLVVNKKTNGILPGDRPCRTCSMKKKWQNVDYKAHISKSTTEQLLKLWQDGEFRKKVTESNSNTWSKRTDELSVRSKKLWEDEEYAAKIAKSLSEYCIINNIKPVCDPSEAAKAGWASEEYRKSKSESVKLLWQDQKYRDNHIRKSREFYADLVNRERARQIAVEACTPDVMEKLAVKRSQQAGRLSKPQQLFYTILDGLGVRYIPEGVATRIGYYSFDCLIPYDYDKWIENPAGERAILIECQSYWHESEKRQRKDSSKFTYTTNYFPQYEICIFGIMKLILEAGS